MRKAYAPTEPRGPERPPFYVSERDLQKVADSLARRYARVQVTTAGIAVAGTKSGQHVANPTRNIGHGALAPIRVRDLTPGERDAASSKGMGIYQGVMLASAPTATVYKTCETASCPCHLPDGLRNLPLALRKAHAQVSEGMIQAIAREASRLASTDVRNRPRKRKVNGAPVRPATRSERVEAIRRELAARDFALRQD